MAKRRARPSPATRASSSSTQTSSSASSPNPLVARLASLTEAQRKDLLAQRHPDFDARVDSYRLLLDAYEGAGGFLDADYLWRFPNEIEGDFTQRQEQSRYHNYYRALVNIYIRHVFRKGVVRKADNLPDLDDWWKDVDGAGTGIDRFMMRGGKLALSAGIAGALVDKEPVPPTGPSRADDSGRVLASWFPATSILDWDLHGGELRGVMLRECAARASILEPQPTGDEAEQTLFWTQEGWMRLDAKGTPIDHSEAGSTIDFVPFAPVRPDPSAEQPFLGYALGGDGQVFRAVFNRCSEEDHVLRNQAFSVLTCDVGKDGDVEAAKTAIGSDIGTTRALVVAGAVDYVTPDMGAPEQIRMNIEFLIREIYRMAHIRFERDSMDAESGDAIRLQFTELNEQLANLATVLQDAEMQMAKAHFAWTHPGDRETVEAEFAAANVVIQYPREFFLADMLDELQKWAQAISMDLGPTFEHYIKNRVVDELAPELPTDLRDKVRTEIDGQQQNRDQSIADAQARFGAVSRIAAPPGKGGPAGDKGTPPPTDKATAPEPESAAA
jgi:hypothetical protein